MKLILIFAMILWVQWTHAQPSAQSFELISNGSFESNSAQGGGWYWKNVNEASPWRFMQELIDFSFGQYLLPNNKYGSFLFAPGSYFEHSFHCDLGSERIFWYNTKTYAHQEFFLPHPSAYGSPNQSYITSFHAGANEFGTQQPKSGQSYAGMIYSYLGPGQFVLDYKCGSETFPYNNTGIVTSPQVRGRIAIPLNEPLDPCRQYSFLAWASKWEVWKMRTIQK